MARRRICYVENWKEMKYERLPFIYLLIKRILHIWLRNLQCIFLLFSFYNLIKSIF